MGMLDERQAVLMGTMSRTRRKEPPNPHRKETKAQRKAHYKAQRRQANQKLQSGSPDEMPRHRRTSGWLTW